MIKISSIIRLKTTIKKIIVVFTVLFILVVVCTVPITGWFNFRTVSINQTNHQIPSYLRPYSNQLNRAISPASPIPIILNIKERECGHPDLDLACYSDRSFQKAILYVQQKVLNSIEDLEKDTSSIVKFIKKTNVLQNQHLKKNAGELRNNNPLIVHSDTETSKEGLKESFFRHGGSRQDIESFNSFYNKLDTYDKRILIQHLSANELKVLQTIGYLVCDSDEIPNKLNNLAIQIHSLVKNIKSHSIDTIAAAAFVHQELIRIRPFQDDSMETARIWMNSLLLLGGFEAVILTEKEYVIATIKDIYNPGVFASFLESAIASNRK